MKTSNKIVWSKCLTECSLLPKCEWKNGKILSASPPARIRASGSSSSLFFIPFLPSGGGDRGGCEDRAYSCRVVTRSQRGVWLMDSAGLVGFS